MIPSLIRKETYPESNYPASLIKKMMMMNKLKETPKNFPKSPWERKNPQIRKKNSPLKDLKNPLFRGEIPIVEILAGLAICVQNIGASCVLQFVWNRISRSVCLHNLSQCCLRQSRLCFLTFSL